MSARLLMGFVLLMDFVLVWGLTPTVARADTTKEILADITKTATNLCGAVTQAGNSTSVEVKGDIKAELTGLLKHLADLGIEGLGTIDEKSYEGVLQEQLADLYDEGETLFERGTALKSNANPDLDKQFYNDIAQWSNKVENWVLANMGPAARARLLPNMTDHPAKRPPRRQEF